MENFTWGSDFTGQNYQNELPPVIPWEFILLAGIQVLYLYISAGTKVQNQNEIVLFIAYFNIGIQAFLRYKRVRFKVKELQ